MQQIGRYKIVEEIGRGSSGVVYRALDPAIFERTIAIKIVRFTGLGDAFETRRLSERLVLETKAVAQLSHRNIINLYDVDQEDGTVQIFMEFVNGPSLKAMLGGRNLPSNPALLDFFRQAADGLDYAHRNGVVHRDVKPANLMLHEESATGERLAKIMDFGVANFARTRRQMPGCAERPAIWLRNRWTAAALPAKPINSRLRRWPMKS